MAGQADADAVATTSASDAGAMVGAPSQSTFGARESADMTRQAQQQAANDVPVDVNPNAALARVQTGTWALQAANFEAGAARRNGILDLCLARFGLQIKAE